MGWSRRIVVEYYAYYVNHATGQAVDAKFNVFDREIGAGPFQGISYLIEPVPALPHCTGLYASMKVYIPGQLAPSVVTPVKKIWDIADEF